MQEKQKTDQKSVTANSTTTKPVSSATSNESAKTTFTFGAAPTPALQNKLSTPAFSMKPSSDLPVSIFNTKSTTDASKEESTASATAKPPTFSFGALNPSAATTSTFSFGGPGVKPFTFTNVAKPVDSSEPGDSKDNNGGGEADEDQPPKYEFVPVVEKDNFYSKRCKVFVKNDKAYTDRGIGMLYLKKVEGSGKTQLLVRADTSLGNILLNVLLSDGLPTQRMGNKDVMLICLPLPDSQAPTSVLIRVKNEEEANDLLAEINKNKK